MSSAAVRIQAGTRLVYDGDAAQVVELLAAQSGVNVVLRVNPDHLVHVPLRELRSHRIVSELSPPSRAQQVMIRGIPPPWCSPS